jgi:chromosome segregation ATPase
MTGMEDSAEQAGSAGSKLDALVTLVEKAAAAIAYLQARNEALARQLQEREHAAGEAAAAIMALRSELDAQGSRIAELEASAQALSQDAQWRRWFHGKYSNSLFYSTIENAYLSDHAMPGEDKNLS